MGSCSSSGKGGGGGNAKAVSTSNLLIDTALDNVTREQVTRVLQDFKREFGISYNNTRIAEMDANSAGVLAFYDGAGIAINNNFLNSQKMDDAYKKCVDSGYHPSSGKKSGMEAVVAHELGHSLNHVVGAKMNLSLDASATRIVKEAKANTKHKNMASLMAKISGYAKESHAEAVAEAIADVYCNGGRARTESKAIVNVMKSYLPKTSGKSILSTGRTAATKTATKTAKKNDKSVIR